MAKPENLVITMDNQAKRTIERLVKSVDELRRVVAAATNDRRTVNLFYHENMRTYMQESGHEVQDLGPELFASSDGTVICWKGVNFYKACGAKVASLVDGGTTTCIKRAGHKSDTCEDYQGITYKED